MLNSNLFELLARRYAPQRQRQQLAEREAHGDDEPSHGRGGEGDEYGPQRRAYQEATGEHGPEEADGGPAHAGGEALGLVGVAGTRPRAIGDLVYQEVHDRDQGVLVDEQEDKVERGHEQSGADEDLPAPPPLAEQAADHVEEEADAPADEQDE